MLIYATPNSRRSPESRPLATHSEKLVCDVNSDVRMSECSTADVTRSHNHSQAFLSEWLEDGFLVSAVVKQTRDVYAEKQF